jgi:hypothetical protein
VTDWASLEACLDAAAGRGDAIRFWWRDDDAGRADPALDRLLELADHRAAPVALAVVTAWLEDSAEAAIISSRQASVLQHGIAHRNRAPLGVKRVELAYRPVAVLIQELERARMHLADVFGTLFVAVLVPPWNRIHPDLVEHLAGRYVGLSTFGARTVERVAPGVLRVDTQLDPVDWRGGLGFVGLELALGHLIELLETSEAPIGVLTHHRVMDEAGWTFLDRLLDLVGRHPGARLCAADELFCASRP